MRKISSAFLWICIISIAILYFLKISQLRTLPTHQLLLYWLDIWDCKTCSFLQINRSQIQASNVPSQSPSRKFSEWVAPPHLHQCHCWQTTWSESIPAYAAWAAGAGGGHGWSPWDPSCGYDRGSVVNTCVVWWLSHCQRPRHASELKQGGERRINIYLDLVNDPSNRSPVSNSYKTCFKETSLQRWHERNIPSLFFSPLC